MAIAAGGLVAPVVGFQPMGLPLGKAFVLSAGVGAGDVFKALAHKVTGGKVPQFLWGIALAWAVTNVKQVKDLLGAEASELIALGLLADTVNDQLRVQERTTDFLGGLFGQRVISKSPPVVSSGGNGKVRSLYGGAF